MGTRHQAREAALGFLYQKDYRLPSVTNEPARYLKHFKVPEAYHPFFMEIVSGVLDHQEEIDREIQDAAQHWKLYRMARVDRTILRIGTWELMKSMSTPAKVVLDEAVELAKVYGAQESAGFVNGILDHIAKKLRSSDLQAVV